MKMKTFDVHTMWGIEKDCTLSVGKYDNNGHIAIQIWCEDGPFATLTVNLPATKKLPMNQAFVDTNNFPGGPALIKQLGIGKRIAGSAVSGFCSYPLYEFDEEALRNWAE